MTGMCRYPIRRAGMLWQLAVMLTFAINAADAQERQYAIGSTVDLVSGSDSNPVNSITGGLPQGSTGPASFFRLYPGISLVRSGGSSTLKASYTLELAGTRGDADYNSLSHGASLTFSYPASSRWRLNLTESFLATSDAASFNGLRGTTPPLAEFRFLFDPVALRLSTRNNTAGINTEYSLNPRSSLSLNASHALRQYGDSAIRTLSLLDQQFVTGSINYTQKTSARDAWSVGYTASYFSFQNFGNTASHTAHVGYSLGISPDVKLELTVGATRVGVLGSSGSLGTGRSHVGYNTLVSITKTKENDSFSVHYRQETGQPSGLGSVSDIRHTGVAVEHRVGTITFFLDASVFDAQQIDNRLQTRGVAVTASIGIPLTKTLSVNGGAQYQRYDQTAPFEFRQQRFFVTLRYNDPKLWTIFR